MPLSSSARPRGDTRRWPGGMWPPARLTTGATTAATTGVCTTTTPATATTTMAPGTQRSHIPTIELTAEVSTLNHRLNISVYIYTNLHYIYLHKMKNKFIFQKVDSRLRTFTNQNVYANYGSRNLPFFILSGGTFYRKWPNLSQRIWRWSRKIFLPI